MNRREPTAQEEDDLNKLEAEASVLRKEMEESRQRFITEADPLLAKMEKDLADLKRETPALERDMRKIESEAHRKLWALNVEMFKDEVKMRVDDAIDDVKDWWGDRFTR